MYPFVLRRRLWLSLVEHFDFMQAAQKALSHARKFDPKFELTYVVYNSREDYEVLTSIDMAAEAIQKALRNRVQHEPSDFGLDTFENALVVIAVIQVKSSSDKSLIFIGCNRVTNSNSMVFYANAENPLLSKALQKEFLHSSKRWKLGGSGEADEESQELLDMLRMKPKESAQRETASPAHVRVQALG